MRWAHAMRVLAFCAAMLMGLASPAATYYVDAVGGSDSNDGLTSATAWKTVGKVNGSTFVAGDQILFKRGCVWNERLTPPSSGASGNPIVFDAYGSGEAPTLTGYVDAPAASWVQDSTNVWRFPITSPESFTYVLFGFVGSDGSVGGVWGSKMTSKTQLVAPYQFYFASSVLYVYSPTATNPASYYGVVAPILMANGTLQLVDVKGKTWLQIQHLKLTYFDTYGLRIRGASDHITVANVSAESMIPVVNTAHGFYASTSPASTNLNFFNVEGLFGSRTGEEKKQSALSFVSAALQLSESVASREIVDEEKFKVGLSKVIDGTVECLNASSWAKR